MPYTTKAVRAKCLEREIEYIKEVIDIADGDSDLVGLLVRKLDEKQQQLGELQK